MDFRNLRTFQLLAERLNFTEVARELNFTQPTITSQIQSLEKELNQTLFYRVGKKNYLTPAGKLLKKYTDEIFQIVDEMEREFEKLQSSSSSINVAAAEFYCIYYFPFILSQFVSMRPDVQVNLISTQSDKVIEGVKNGTYDVGVIAGHVTQSGLQNVVLEEEEYVPVVSKDLYDKYSFTEIIHLFPFVKFKIESGFQMIIENFIEQFTDPPKKMIEFGSEEAIRRAIKNGLGYGLLSKNMIEDELKEGELIKIPLTNEKMIFQTSLIYLKVNKANDVLRSFTKLVKIKWKQSYEDS